jgi:hypothetical protein
MRRKHARGTSGCSHASGRIAIDRHLPPLRNLPALLVAVDAGSARVFGETMEALYGRRRTTTWRISG